MMVPIMEGIGRSTASAWGRFGIILGLDRQARNRQNLLEFIEASQIRS